jgi:quinohemoprotein ethanol dehydrogenase
MDILRFAAAGVCLGQLAAPPPAAPIDDSHSTRHGAMYRLLDGSDGRDWAGYGRTFGEQHYSPLVEINDRNVGSLGLAWDMDLTTNYSSSVPLAVGGVLFFTTGYSIIHAVDAVTGRPLWVFDSKAAEMAGHKLRQGWGSRGIAWWNGKIYTGTQDGRLIALDASSGKVIWSVLTVQLDDWRYISGAPRVFDGKVIIGHGGADIGATRGYVTTYDAETGRFLWRFYTVPGNPANGFEDSAQAMAAKTWFGEWWKQGGGGTVWNAMSVDPETDTVFIGTGNGAPWNRMLRSEGKGDNLFLASIVALNASTGAYKWHYQVNPGETWDYTATMDMELATLTIDGKPRKVLMEAPKNGFFYVIDRITGKLISAKPFAKVNWASKIDLATGRPVENADSRFENGPELQWPGPQGAHNWPPMSFNPKTGLVYIPTYDLPATYDATGIDAKTWTRYPGGAMDGGVNVDITPNPPGAGAGSLIAWNPVSETLAWRVPNPGFWNGGTMTTAGNLVFQGLADGTFNAYDAKDGKRLWSFAAGSGIIAPPISYQANGRQYITVLSGFGASGSIYGERSASAGWEARTQARRVLTFALGANRQLPPPPPTYRAVAAIDPDYAASDADTHLRGAIIFGRRCATCHGVTAIAGGAAPDLRASPIPISLQGFDRVVRQGVLVAHGMPRFEELTDQEMGDLRQYIRDRSHDLAISQHARSSSP